MKNAVASTLLSLPLALAQSGWTGLTLRSASPIHFQSLNATGGALWLEKPTSTYCPLQPASDCPPGNTTVFTFPTPSSNGTLSMDVEVPGGQQVYIDPLTSAVLLSTPHASAPSNAILGGWSYTYSPSQGFGFVSQANGLVACPSSGSGDEGVGPWQIFAPTSGFNNSNCLGFDLLAANYTGTGAAAWEYA